MKCPSCHKEVEKGSLYCPHCLSEIPWVREFDSVETQLKKRNSRTQVKKVTGKDCLQESLFITGRGLLLSVWQLQSFWERFVTGSYILFRHYTVMPASSLSRSIMEQRSDL